MEPFPPVDVPELARRVGRADVRASLAEIGVRGALELLSTYWFDEAEARRYAGDAPRNTDDRPRTEFFAPRGVFDATVGINLEEMASVRPDRGERAVRLGLESEDRASFEILAAASDDAARGHARLLAGDVDGGMSLLEPIAASGQKYAAQLVADQAVVQAGGAQRAGDADGARRRFDLALRFDPDRLEALVGAGYLDLLRGDIEGADRRLSRAVELYPRSAGAAWRLGAVRLAQGRMQEAERLLLDSIKRQPGASRPHGLLGAAWLAEGRTAEAASAFVEAARLGDDTEGTAVGLAEARLASGDIAGAVAAAREAVRRHPGSEDARTVLRLSEAAARGSRTP
jgi:tetratricopeptide (TPR) repeat protein